MKIVIDIPDEQIEKSLAENKYIHEDEGEKSSVDIVLLYTNKKLEFVAISRKTDFYDLTDKYTILPEGHGRLIDADALIKKSSCMATWLCDHKECDTCQYRCVAKYEIEDAETIIPADKEGD